MEIKTIPEHDFYSIQLLDKFKDQVIEEIEGDRLHPVKIVEISSRSNAKGTDYCGYRIIVRFTDDEISQPLYIHHIYKINFKENIIEAFSPANSFEIWENRIN